MWDQKLLKVLKNLKLLNSKIKKPADENNGLDHIINKVQDEIKQQEQIEQPIS